MPVPVVPTHRFGVSMTSAHDGSNTNGGGRAGPFLRIEPLHWDGHRHVTLIGEIDLANVGEAESVLELMAKRGMPLVLDCAGLTYCDSQAIAMVFRLAEQARDAGGSLTIVNPRGIVRRVFEVTRVADAVAVVEDTY